MYPLAIDISDTIIRLVALERKRKTWRILVRAEVPVPAGFLNDGDIKQLPELSELLGSLVKATNMRNVNVAVTLPERHTFIKLISLPTSSSNALEQAVSTALSQHIPYAPEEMYWDWHRVNELNSLGQPQILIGAAPRSTVNEYLHLFEMAGLRVEAAEIESLAIVRALFGPEPPDEARIVVDLGRTRSTLILVDHGIVQFSSTLRYTGRELNRFIADELNISLDQAERAKTLFGLDPKRGKGVLRAALAPHIDAIANGITEVEEYWQEHYIDHRPISTVHLTGSGALLRGIKVELRERLEQTIVVEPSWMYSELLKSDPHLPPELGFTYTTVFGVATRPWLMKYV